MGRVRARVNPTARLKDKIKEFYDGKIEMNFKLLLFGSLSVLAVIVLFFASVSTSDVGSQSKSDNYKELCGYQVTDEMRLEIIYKYPTAGSEPLPYLQSHPGNFTHVEKSQYLEYYPSLKYWFELEDNRTGYFELGACDLDDSNITFGMPNKIQPKPTISDFDTTKYEALEAPGRPLIYKETLRPVLDIDNCQRIADGYTKEERWELFTRETTTFHPAWENQVFPLMDYCASLGNFVLKTADGNINWNFIIR